MSPRKPETQRGICPVCLDVRALTSDGRIYRHYGGPAGPEYVWPDGVCRGWGQPAKTKDDHE